MYRTRKELLQKLENVRQIVMKGKKLRMSSLEEGILKEDLLEAFKNGDLLPIFPMER